MNNQLIDFYQWYLGEDEFIISVCDNSVITSKNRNIFFINTDEYDLALDWTNTKNSPNTKWRELIKKEMEN